jgi:putative cell wall-binding protein
VYEGKAPLLLTRRNVLPSPTRYALSSSDATVTALAGGPATVTDSNLNRMEREVGHDIARVWGADRYVTAAEVAKYGVAQGISTYEYIGVANGADEKFADALCGGPAVGSHGGVMLLTQPDVLPWSTRGVLGAAADDVRQVQVFGGPKSVSDGVIDEVRDAIR